MLRDKSNELYKYGGFLRFVNQISHDMQPPTKTRRQDIRLANVGRSRGEKGSAGKATGNMHLGITALMDPFTSFS